MPSTMNGEACERTVARILDEILTTVNAMLLGEFVLATVLRYEDQVLADKPLPEEEECWLLRFFEQGPAEQWFGETRAALGGYRQTLAAFDETLRGLPQWKSAQSAVDRGEYGVELACRLESRFWSMY